MIHKPSDSFLILVETVGERYGDHGPGSSCRHATEADKAVAQRGHLSLIEATDGDHRQGKEIRNQAPKAGTTVNEFSECSMPKRLYKQNRTNLAVDAASTLAPRAEADPDVPNIKREFILTRGADETLDDVVRLLSRATGTSVSNSHLLRAVLKLVAHAMPQIERAASHLGPMKRPGNARGNEAERNAYEDRLAEVIAAGLRSCRPFGADGTDRRKPKGSGDRSA